MNYLKKNQSRQNNVIIDGLMQDNACESWFDTEQTVKLKIDPKSTEIERAHRTGNVDKM